MWNGLIIILGMVCILMVIEILVKLLAGDLDKVIENDKEEVSEKDDGRE